MQQEPDPKKRIPLPEAKDRPVMPPHKRWPLEGKMQPPTVPPMTAVQRRNQLRVVQKRKQRRSYLIGLLVGQILIVGLIFGGEAIVRHFGSLSIDIPLRLLVFAGITGGIVVTGALIAVLLLFQALAYVFRPKGKPFGTALWNGIRRVARATFSLGICLVVLGGTAAVTVPFSGWKPSGKRLWTKGKSEYDKIKGRLQSKSQPDASKRR